MSWLFSSSAVNLSDWSGWKPQDASDFPSFGFGSPVSVTDSWTDGYLWRTVRLRWAYPPCGWCLWKKWGLWECFTSFQGKHTKVLLATPRHEAALTQVSEWGILGHYIPSLASCKPQWVFWALLKCWPCWCCHPASETSYSRILEL